MTNITKNSAELRFSEFQEPLMLRKAKELFENSRKKGNDDLPIYSVTQGRGLVPRSSLDRHMEADATADKNLYVGPKYLAYNMMRMWQGAVGMATQECMVSPAYIVLKPKNLLHRLFSYISFRKRGVYIYYGLIRMA